MSKFTKSVNAIFLAPGSYSDSKAAKSPKQQTSSSSSCLSDGNSSVLDEGGSAS